MRLTGTDGTSLLLEPIRYEVPGSPLAPAMGDDGLDWLVWRVDAECSRGAWGTVDACISTAEARVLVAWLLDVAARRWPQPDMVFIEPLLEFEALLPEGDGLRFRIYFALEANPPWHSRHEGWYEDRSLRFHVDLTIAFGDLVEAAGALAAELEPFPIRAPLPRRRLEYYLATYGIDPHEV